MPSIDSSIVPAAPGASVMCLLGALLLRFGGVFERVWVGSLAAAPEPWEARLFERMAGENAGRARSERLASEPRAAPRRAKAPALV